MIDLIIKTVSAIIAASGILTMKLFHSKNPNKDEKTKHYGPVKVHKMSQEEQQRIRNTPIEELFESGEWVKLYDLDRPMVTIYGPGYLKAQAEAYKIIDDILENAHLKEKKTE